ncbi:hypothetical protein BJ165DRAFT_1525828 [Panaeolus papilionaceus]|nr:hypothetical protein BJ165DRAFT_1525828 [Panaeolus papilionaceus]
MSKKATKNTSKEVAQYQYGEHVLGKVRGYPPWPGIITNPTDVPVQVLGEQPTGKKAQFYCVCFFPTGDYAWLHSKDISSLKKHEIESFLKDESKKRNGDLREGYRIAQNPDSWLSARKSRESAAASASAEPDDAEVDELHSEDHAAGDDDEEGSGSGKKPKTKKRKRESEAGENASAAISSSKAKKAPRTKKEKEVTEPKKKPTTSTARRSKKNGVKSNAAVESEDDADHDDAEGEEVPSVSKKKPSPPPAKKAKRDKDEDGDDAKGTSDPQSLKVRDWRHKLQKTFLSNKGTPKAEAMPEIDELFKTVEGYDGMSIEQLQFSKIGKVMRHIAARSESDIPRDDEFKFRTRAKALVDRWHQILNTKAGGAANNSSPEATTAHEAGMAVMLAVMNGDEMTAPRIVISDEKEHEDVTRATKNLDLNGKEDAIGSPAADAEAEADGEVDGMTVDQNGAADGAGEADTSVLADVTMSEA